MLQVRKSWGAADVGRAGGLNGVVCVCVCGFLRKRNSKTIIPLICLIYLPFNILPSNCGVDVHLSSEGWPPKATVFYT